MSKMAREEKLFKKEHSILSHYQEMTRFENSSEESGKALRSLTSSYKSLLDQTRFLTWISGRLERKLYRTNQELRNSNDYLQRTLNDLTKAEASRSAYAIIYFVAICLFVLEELFVEPVIKVLGDSIGYGILIKLFIVMLLKLSEGFLEKKMTRNRLKKKLKLSEEINKTG